MKKLMIIILVVGMFLTGCTYSIGDFGLDADYRFSNYEEYKDTVDDLDSDYFAVERVETFELKDVDSLETSTIFEDIEIYRENRKDIEIRYFGIFSDKTSDKKPEYTIDDKNDAKFLVKWEKLVGSNHARMEIFLPNDFDEDFKIRSISGDIQSEDVVSTELNISTVSGDIRITDIVAENIKINSTSGDIDVDYAEVEELEVDTVSGAVRFSVDEQKGDIEIDSVSGDITLEVKDINADIDFGSVSGDVVSIELDKTDKKKEHALRGSIGKGKYTIEIDTVSGDIKLK